MIPAKLSFSPSGNNPQDFWLIENSDVFGFFPGGVVDGYDEALPIKLHIGNRDYGAQHITNRHPNHTWPKKFSGKATYEIVYDILGYSGNIMNSVKSNQCKISIIQNGNILVILEYRYIGHHKYWSITTCYKNNSKLDGIRLGKYEGRTQRSPNSD